MSAHLSVVLYFRTSGPSVAGLETTYTGGNGFSTSYNSQRWLNLYLSACKFLDLALALPSENLPQFQMWVDDAIIWVSGCFTVPLGKILLFKTFIFLFPFHFWPSSKVACSPSLPGVRVVPRANSAMQQMISGWFDLASGWRFFTPLMSYSVIAIYSNTLLFQYLVVVMSKKLRYTQCVSVSESSDQMTDGMISVWLLWNHSR